MTGAGIGELIWLVIAVLLGLGVVITWIIKSETSRNFLKAEMKKLRSQLDAAEREKVIIMEEMQSPNPASSGNAAVGKMVEKVGELERDNARLKKELNEARSSLEEVYKALCSK